MGGIVRLPSAETTANSYLIEEEGLVILIDVVRSADLICAELSERKASLDRIILTHEHMDHVFGLEELRGRTGAPVISTAECSTRMGDRRQNLSLVYDMLVYAYTGTVTKKRHRPFTCSPADITFDDRYCFEWIGHTFDITRCPGHSPGSSIIIMDNTCAFTGDYLSKDTPDNLGLLGGSEEEYRTITEPWINSRLVPGMSVYPGHGKPYVL